MAREIYFNCIIITVLITFFGFVTANYCEWDLCGPDQYCCGTNICCNNVYSLWYFWASLIILVVLLSTCGGSFLRYCFAVRNQIILKPVAKYVPLLNENPTSDNSEQFCPFTDRDKPQNDDTSATPIARDDVNDETEHSNSFSGIARGPPPPYSKNPVPGESVMGFGSWS